MKIDARKAAVVSAILVVMFVLSYAIYSGRTGQAKVASNIGQAPISSYTTEDKPPVLEGVDSNSGENALATSQTSSTVPEETVNIQVADASASSPFKAEVVKSSTINPVSTPAKPAQVKVASRGTITKAAAPETKTVTNVQASGNGISAVNYAKQFLGRPYVYGASGPASFDCSGLTAYVFKNFGVSLPRRSADQSRFGQYVPKGSLQPGDLVFFTTDGSGSVSHVGIYVGGGQFIHAPHSGATVSITSMNSSYYTSRYVTARRVIN